MNEDIFLEPNVTITPGCIDVSSVVKVYENDQVQLWTIDARTKYYEVFYTSCDKNGLEIALTTNEDTLKANEDLEDPTIVEILFDPPTSWYLFTYSSFARYSISVCLYKEHQIEEMET